MIQELLYSRRALRQEFQHYLEAQVDAADEACRGILLSTLGRVRGIDPASLFMGPTARAHKYASTELLEWWMDHPRITFTEWERQAGTYPAREWGMALQDSP